MIKSIKEKAKGKIEIDLTGPQGNAFFLLGTARKLSQQLGLNWEEINKEMTAGDYEELLAAFEKHFGGFVILYR